MIKIFSPLAAAFIALSTPLASSAQYTSNQPVKIIVGQASGSGSDIAGRVLAEELAKAIERPVIVENRPGALGTLGTAEVAKAPPDGHTLLLIGGTAISAAPFLIPIPYNPRTDLAPIYQLASSPMILYVGSKLPVHNVKELVQLVSSQPGKHSYASHHALNKAAMSEFAARMKLDMVDVQYKGGGQALTDVVSGVITAMFNDISGSASLQDAGRIRPLAVMSKARTPLAPEIPTVFEEGYNGPVFSLWTGLFAPAGTPEPIIRYLNAKISKIVANPAIKERFKKLGLEVYSDSTPESFAKYIAQETEVLGPILKAQSSAKSSAQSPAQSSAQSSGK